jgi:ATP-dependent DNA helicase RecQ
VLHADPPASLDAYYEEIECAGRDGDAARARLLYPPEDIGTARHLTTRGVSASVVAVIADRLASLSQAATAEELRTALPVGSRALILAIARLVDLGAANWEADGRLRWSGALSVGDTLRGSHETDHEREVERSRLEMMRRYAEHTGCRRSFLLSYVGQHYPGPCGACDNDRQRSPNKHGSEPFPIGARGQPDLGRRHRAALRRRSGHRPVRRPWLPRSLAAGRTRAPAAAANLNPAQRGDCRSATSR